MELAKAIENAAKEVLAVADMARRKGYADRKYFERIADAYRALVDALSIMRAVYGEVDPAEHEKIMSELLKG